VVYVPNHKKADQWGKAIRAGVDVFEKLEEQIKAEGFTRPILIQIIIPVFPFFEQLDPEDVEEVFQALEYYSKDFWEDYDRIMVREAKRDFPDEEIEPPSTAFWSTLSSALDEHHLYDKLLNI
jgi:hypothetical protein